MSPCPVRNSTGKGLSLAGQRRLKIQAAQARHLQIRHHAAGAHGGRLATNSEAEEKAFT